VWPLYFRGPLRLHPVQFQPNPCLPSILSIGTDVGVEDTALRSQNRATGIMYGLVFACPLEMKILDIDFVTI
jgi:hypothetical protein